MLMQRTLGFDFETADAADTMAKLSLSAPSAPVVAAPLRRGRSAGGEHAAPLHADSAPFVNRSSIAFGYNRYGGGGMAASAMPPMMAVSYPPGTLGAHWQTQWLIMKAQFDEREVVRRRVEELGGPALPCSAAPMRACETAHHPSPAPSWSSQQRTLVLRPAPALAANGLAALVVARAPPGCF